MIKDQDICMQYKNQQRVSIGIPDVLAAVDAAAPSELERLYRDMQRHMHDAEMFAAQAKASSERADVVKAEFDAEYSRVTGG